MQLELLIIEAFAHPHVRARWRSLLTSRRGRQKFRDRLAHHFECELNPAVAVLLPGRVHSGQAIQQLIASLCDHTTCHVISSSALDGREVELPEALHAVVGWGKPSILSIIPGVLAYFEPEMARDNRWLLVNDAAMRAKLAKVLTA